MARNRNGEVYVVCNYNPPGNFLGSFVENVIQPIDESSPASSLGNKSPVADKKKDCRYDEKSWQEEALAIHNEYRKKHRVPELKLNPELCAAAKVT